MADVDLTDPAQRRGLALQAEEHHRKRLDEYKPTDDVDALCHDASRGASRGARDDGLYPELTTEGEYRYTIQQGLRSAHWAREDAAATLILMRPVLYSLRRITRLLWVIVALACLILWRVW